MQKPKKVIKEFNLAEHLPNGYKATCRIPVRCFRSHGKIEANAPILGILTGGIGGTPKQALEDLVEMVIEQRAHVLSYRREKTIGFARYCRDQMKTCIRRVKQRAAR